MKISQLILTAALVSICTNLKAQNTYEDWQKLYYSELNSMFNPNENITSPIKIASNVVSDYSDISMKYSIEEGDFKSIYSGDKLRTLSIGLLGGKSVDKFKVEGGVTYNNSYEWNQAWNTALYNTPSNPFVVGDSDPSDRIIEEFLMHGTALYSFNKLTAGVNLVFNTGSLYGQADPRTETVAMRFSVTPAFSYAVNRVLSIGASFKLEKYNSQTEHTIVNTYYDYNYYLQKGSGNFTIKSSGEVLSYPRDYIGDCYQAAIQLMLGGSDQKVQNSTEIAYVSNTEISKDASSTVVFNTGDFFQKIYSISNRTTIRKAANYINNINISLSLESNQGWWYNQKKVTNSDYANITYYETLLYYKLNEATIMSADLEYQLAILKQERPNYLLSLQAQFISNNTSQNDGNEYGEQYSNTTLGASVRKFSFFNGFTLDFAINGAITQNLSDPIYIGESNDITETFTNPYFAYLSSQSIRYGADVNCALNIESKVSSAGLRVRAYQISQLGQSPLYTFAKKSRNYIQTTIYYIF